MLSVTMQAGVDSKTVKKQDFESVTVDSTVQEKAITYPTDGKFYECCRQHLVRLEYPSKLFQQIVLELRQKEAVSLVLI